MVERECKQCGAKFMTHNCYIKRGNGKFCSTGCGTTFRNIHNNPTKDPAVRKKISDNHADVSGKNNPMYGVRGKDAPGYIHGLAQDKVYRRIARMNIEFVCHDCGKKEIDGYR